MHLSEAMRSTRHRTIDLTSSFCCMRISAAASAARMACRRSSSTCSLRCRVRCMRAADLAADKRRSYSIRVSSCSKQHKLAQQVCGDPFKRMLLLLRTVPLPPAPHAGGEFVSLKDVLAPTGGAAEGAQAGQRHSLRHSQSVA